MTKHKAEMKKDDFDFEVLPSSANTNFLDIFSKLEEQRSLIKWKEIKDRYGESELPILIETALELSSTGKQGKLFRKSDDSNEILSAIWLSKVLGQAKRTALRRLPRAFTGLTAEHLRNIAKMSRDIESPKVIGDYLLTNFGIILVCNRAFLGMKLDGIATKLNSDHPVIGISLRYSRYDNFWFTLMHELAHVTLHYDLLASAICDDFEEVDDSDIEREANRLATDSIIPRRIFQKSNVVRSRLAADLNAMAEQAEVHPALAAGIVRHSSKNYAVFSDVVNGINVREMLGMN